MVKFFSVRQAYFAFVLSLALGFQSARADDQTKQALDLAEKAWYATRDAWNHLEISGSLQTFDSNNRRLYDATISAKWVDASYRFELLERQARQRSDIHDRVVVVSDGESILKATFGRQFHPTGSEGDVYSAKDHTLRSVAHTFLHEIHEVPRVVIDFPRLLRQREISCVDVNEDLVRCEYTIPVSNVVTVDLSRRHAMNVIRLQCVAEAPSTAFHRFDVGWKEIEGKWVIDSVVNTVAQSDSDYERHVFTVTERRSIKDLTPSDISMDSLKLHDNSRIIDRRKMPRHRIHLYRTPENRENISETRPLTISEEIAKLPAR